MQQLVILLVISCSSTCFGRLYTHHQEVRLRFTAYGFLSCCSCCYVGESAVCTQLAIRFSNITTHTTGQATYSTQCTQLAIRFSNITTHTTRQATYSIQCTQLATRLSNITTVTTGQKTIGSETQSDLLMMGVKTPETCWGTTDYQ
jgi:hypothetical protein